MDEVCGTAGSNLVVGGSSSASDRVRSAHFLCRGENRPHVTREFSDLFRPRNTGIRRLTVLPSGQPVHLPELLAEDERKTSPLENEGLRGLGERKLPDRVPQRGGRAAHGPECR